MDIGEGTLISVLVLTCASLLGVLLKQRVDQAAGTAAPSVESPSGVARRNVVLLLGLPGVGKSQVVKTLTSHSDVGGDDTGNDLHIADWTSTLDAAGTQYLFGECRADEATRVGRALTADKRFENRVTSLVLVVDLFEPLERDPGESWTSYQDRADRYGVATKPSVATARVGEQLGAWHEAIVELVGRELLTHPLEGICLFINKADKWTEWDYRTDSPAVVRHFRRLTEVLADQARTSDIDLVTVVGSALRGVGIVGRGGLLTHLQAWSARVTAGTNPTTSPDLPADAA